MTKRIFRFLDEIQPETPCLVVDLEEVSRNFLKLQCALPATKIYYAVKANPAPEILRLLHQLRAYFDAASIYEIEQCLDIGIKPDHLSFGNTIKKESHIHQAYDRGIRLFAFDSEAELEKLARAAPGSKVYCRFYMTGEGADWPLSKKFGCDALQVPYLIKRASHLGLDPLGVSFHVGSQQRGVSQWSVALQKSAEIFQCLAAEEIELGMVNIGGGFPANYRTPNLDIEEHTVAIEHAITKYFGNRPPQIIAEPGRFISGDAGVIQSEIVLIAEKSRNGRRWVYLDIGRFGGLPEVMGGAIRYKILSRSGASKTGPVVLAGPTCDEVDVLYDDLDYELPLDLKVGDKIELLSAGAYTASYSAVGFNGFPPLREIYI